MQFRIVLDGQAPSLPLKVLARIEAVSESRTYPCLQFVEGGRLSKKIIKLDAANWTMGYDFYDAILPQLGAPEGHGKNHNAIVESMVWGGINKLEPPYAVEIVHTNGRPRAVLDEIRLIANFFVESRAKFRERKGRDTQVSFQIVS